MIELTSGNMLKAEVEAIVNTVNCVGAMGRGIAAQVERAFPEESKIYKKACANKQLKPGQVLVTEVQLQMDRPLPLFLIHFATKDHWRQPSEAEWIREGLVHLVEEIKARKIRSIAIPPLGCGHGGLSWDVVKPMIYQALDTLPDVRVLLYPPMGAPAPEEMVNNKPAPRAMTLSHALYIQMLERYCTVEPVFSHLELQKLAYFLQEAGESSLKLKFEKGKFGPYAPDMRHILERWEGHWSVGYGDGTGGVGQSMTLKPKATEMASRIVEAQKDPAVIERVDRVMQLVEGYESFEGVELLATVHWVGKTNPKAAQDVEIAVKEVQQWNERKSLVFGEHLISEAWSRLRMQGWLDVNLTIEDKTSTYKPQEELTSEDMVAITEEWEITNERRIDLVYKMADGKLSAKEEQELAHLQFLLEAKFEQENPTRSQKIEDMEKVLIQRGLLQEEDDD